MVLGYRHWSGIGVKEDCMASLDWYQNAAEKGESRRVIPLLRLPLCEKDQMLIIPARTAYKHFLAGPPGGRTLPLNPTKLSDLAGGLYGFGASWASTGMNVVRAGIKAGSSVSGGETFDDVIEYYRVSLPPLDCADDGEKGQLADLVWFVYTESSNQRGKHTSLPSLWAGSTTLARCTHNQADSSQVQKP